MKFFGRSRLLYLLLVLLAVVLAAKLFVPRPWLRFAYNYTVGRFFQYSAEERVRQFGAAARIRLQLDEMPSALRLLVLKAEKRLEVYGRNAEAEPWKLLKIYPVLAASGTAGPKLQQGDLQVPEGCYAIESLHPNSAFYLALRVAYPNPEDIAMAELDGRDVEQLGGDIMIHGKGGSVGCIAIADEAMEELFTLANHTGCEAIELLIAPCDLRRHPLPEAVAGTPSWLPERYRLLREKMLDCD